MKKLIVFISGEWVLDRWEDEVSPSQYVCDFMGTQYANLKLVDSGFTVIEFDVTEEDFNFQVCIAHLKAEFAKRYGLEEENDI